MAIWSVVPIMKGQPQMTSTSLVEGCHQILPRKYRNRASQHYQKEKLHTCLQICLSQYFERNQRLDVTSQQHTRILEKNSLSAETDTTFKLMSRTTKITSGNFCNCQYYHCVRLQVLPEQDSRERCKVVDIQTVTIIGQF